MSDNLVLERPTRPPDMGLPPRPAPPRPPGPIPAPVPPQLLPHRRPAELAGSSAFPADRASAKKAPDTGKSGKILEQKLGLRRTGLTGPHQTDSGGRVRPTCGQEQAERPRKAAPKEGPESPPLDAFSLRGDEIACRAGCPRTAAKRPSRNSCFSDAFWARRRVR
jgi:hypothetical protein